MENLLLYILIGIFAYAGISVLVSMIWAESPAMLIFCVTAGCIMSYLNGDWD